jgi:nitroreductase
MDVFDAMRTTRAMRRLDNDRPVSDEDIWTIVEMATKAPTGGNSQPVRWIVVTDADKRRRLGDIYRECWARSGRCTGRTPRPTTGGRAASSTAPTTWASTWATRR